MRPSDDSSRRQAIGEVTVTDADGREQTSAYCDVWRFENGKMAELRAFVVDR